MIGKVKRINISQERGVIKDSVESVEVLENWGLEGDGHVGNWECQVSIFPLEALERVPEEMKEEVMNGGYTENFSIEGLPLEELRIGTVLKVGQAEIEIYRIGKDIFKEHDRHYIVSREGRFGKVLKGGSVSVGDEIYII